MKRKIRTCKLIKPTKAAQDELTCTRRRRQAGSAHRALSPMATTTTKYRAIQTSRTGGFIDLQVLTACAAVLTILLTGCGGSSGSAKKPSSAPAVTTSAKPATTTAKSSKPFTNKYGTPTTLCAHSGCTNYIASSGDTNCCTTHSNKCANCGKYIDEDAMYCMDCLTKAMGG